MSVSQLQDDFAEYPYLPRLPNPDTLVEAVVDGVASLTPEDGFAYADSYDESRERYVGLKLGEQLSNAPSPGGLLVKPEGAQLQLEAERSAEREHDGGTRASTGATASTSGDTSTGGRRRPISDGQSHEESGSVAETAAKKTRFFGSKKLKPTSPGSEAGKISEEVIQHLAELVRSEITVTLEIEAHVPDGIPDEKVRTIRENCDALKFDQHDFEEEL